MKVKFTLSARGQFLDALEYIAKDNPLAAQRVRVRVEKALKRLTTFPNSGRRIPEFPELPHRELIVDPYRMFYRVEGNVLWVTLCN
jgi:toxin ParE1/3/4